MRVLVLGASGMAGHMVSLYLRENGFTVDTLSARHSFDKDTRLIDVTDINNLTKFLDSKQYNVVIDCIGLLVKQCEERKDLAVYLNSYLPHFLENYYKNTGTKVIHISTDEVFSSKNMPYRENSAYDSESFYGRTKALGEITNDKDLTFRTSIIGPSMQKDGTGLFNWFYQQTGEISGYTKTIWNGVTTLELAKAMKASIEQNLTGIYHLVPKNSISKFDLLRLLKEVFDHEDMTIKSVDGLDIDRTLTNTRRDFNYLVPDYRTMVGDLRPWIEGHPDLYKHYEK